MTMLYSLGTIQKTGHVAGAIFDTMPAKNSVEFRR
jgi:hypothetical protein